MTYNSITLVTEAITNIKPPAQTMPDVDEPSEKMTGVVILVDDHTQ